MTSPEKHALLSAEEERKQFEKLQLLHKSTVNMLEAVTKERDEHIKHSRDELAARKVFCKSCLQSNAPPSKMRSPGARSRSRNQTKSSSRCVSNWQLWRKRS